MRRFYLFPVLVFLFGAILYPLAPAYAETSLRFFGSGVRRPGFDRVIIPVDQPETPADIGAQDFTVEFWLKGRRADNPTSGQVNCNQTVYNWFYGSTVFDRDRLDTGLVPDGNDFGISIFSNEIAFGVQRDTQFTMCTEGASILDNAWHHVAVQRTVDGLMEIFVDGQLSGRQQGPAGDISFPNGAATSGRVAERAIVLGAEKHDFGADYPSFNGFVDELRISSGRRYTADFIPQRSPFTPDATTLALYHFDSISGPCMGTVPDALASSPGECAFQEGPVYSEDTPFVAALLDPQLTVRARRQRRGILVRGSTLSSGTLEFLVRGRVVTTLTPSTRFSTRLRGKTRSVVVRQEAAGGFSSASVRRRIR